MKGAGPGAGRQAGSQGEKAGPLCPWSMNPWFQAAPWAEEEGGGGSQAMLSRAVSINLGVALDCGTNYWGSLGGSLTCDSVSLSVNGANNNPQLAQLC